MKDLYTKNHTHKWNKLISRKTYHVHGIEDLILLKCPCYLKLSYQILSNTYQDPLVFFTEIEKNILKFRWNYTKTFNSQSNSEKEQSWESSYFLISNCITNVQLLK